MKLFKFLYDFLLGPDKEEQYRPKVSNRRQANSGYRHTGSGYRQSGQYDSCYGSPDAYRGTEQECLTEYYGDEDPDCGFHSYSGAYYEDDDSDSGFSFFGGGDGGEE